MANDEPSQEFRAFMAKHNKQYDSPEEEKHRYSIYLKNLEKISQHNEKFDRGEVSYTMKVTQFADLTPEECSRSLGLRNSSNLKTCR